MQEGINISLYYRNLKKMGIFMIIAAIGNLVLELLLRHFLSGTASVYLANIPISWGIWVKNLIGVAAGLTALCFYMRKRNYTVGTIILTVLCAAEVAVIILSTTG